ncbi:HPr kinase [Thermosediminibacter oceani DSM 16646]|uniref:HPr kinase n=1 Tax=Thermosediminibacter oceani (strain ATCC BAA-1034 / DSM 16646 / JW/IW-1228P) TaxID=555079 RepID=D9S234_THEOJ|nr:HPr kinase [Thermosediminibacter oceani DSM 16646]
MSDLQKELSLKLVTRGTTLDRPVVGGYASDLLSWVMGHATENQVWITIQSHPNIVAVASLLGLSGIIVAEGAEIEENTIKKAEEENIPVFSSEKPVYEICGMLYNLLSRSRKKC